MKGILHYRPDMTRWQVNCLPTELRTPRHKRVFKALCFRPECQSQHDGDDDNDQQGSDHTQKQAAPPLPLMRLPVLHEKVYSSVCTLLSFKCRWRAGVYLSSVNFNRDVTATFSGAWNRTPGIPAQATHCVRTHVSFLLIKVSWAKPRSEVHNKTIKVMDILLLSDTVELFLFICYK